MPLSVAVEPDLCLCGAPAPCGCFSPTERRALLNRFALSLDVVCLLGRAPSFIESVRQIPCYECGSTYDSVRMDAFGAGINPNTAICCEVVL